MSLATVARSQAIAAYRRYGAPVTLAHKALGTGPGTTGDVTMTVSTHGLLDASSYVTMGFKFGADLVRGGDHLLTIPGGLAADPVEGDTVTVRSITWQVVRVRPLYLGADVVTFELLVRR